MAGCMGSKVRRRLSRPETPRARRRKRYAVGAACLGVALAVTAGFARQRPGLAAWLAVAVVAGLAYNLGYFVTRKAGRVPRPHRNRVIGSAVALMAVFLAAPWVVAAQRAEASWPFLVTAGVMGVGGHLVGRALARKRAKRSKPPGRESALAHQYLDGLKGLEIGGSAHNPFGLDTLNVDYTLSTETVFKQAELEIAGKTLPVNVVASGDALPFLDGSHDFVVSSHVLEHFPDPIKALREWYRVIKPGGYIVMIVPHKERTFDRERPRTTLAELIDRHRNGWGPGTDQHCSVWITEDVVDLIEYLGWEIAEVQDVDDKAGNGFTLLVRKTATACPSGAR